MPTHTTEREVKLLVARSGLDLSRARSATEIAQVYLAWGKASIRVRRYPDGHHELTVKLPLAGDGSSEYDLPLGEVGPRLYAEALANGFAEIRKTRYRMPGDHLDPPGLEFEVDVFHGRFGFLTVAELEYPGPDRPRGLDRRPDWYPEGPWGVDVTSDRRFKNSALVALDDGGIGRLAEEYRRLLDAAGDSPPGDAILG